MPDKYAEAFKKWEIAQKLLYPLFGLKFLTFYFEYSRKNPIVSKYFILKIETKKCFAISHILIKIF